MPWLADLVESSEGSFSVLPVQCLCEFLLNDSFSPGEEETAGRGGKRRKAGELLVHLQALLQDPASDPGRCLETLEYFLARLSSVQSSARLQALSGLRLLLTPVPEGTEEPMETEEQGSSDWLLRHLPALPCFSILRPRLATALRRACEVECYPPTVSLYIRSAAG
jgi:integrator complex subunit 1